MGTTGVSIYAFSAQDGRLLWQDQLGMETGGFTGGYGYCMGPAVWKDFVVAGALVFKLAHYRRDLVTGRRNLRSLSLMKWSRSPPPTLAGLSFYVRNEAEGDFHSPSILTASRPRQHLYRWRGFFYCQTSGAVLRQGARASR